MTTERFSKRYNRKEIEEKWRRKWSEDNIYKFRYDPEKPMYVVDTPPPYVNAEHLHVGHIMSYSQAEFVVRFKRMRGYNVFYPMGFDDNGYPTEKFVENKYKVDKRTISKQEFIDLCLKETEIGAQNYKDLWTQLGISVDWDLTYSTISPLAVKVSQRSLLDLNNKGLLYRKESPILWCTQCDTAVAQADLEDKEFTVKLNYITLKSVSGKDLTIATTRPELLPACVALYVNPNDKRYKKLVGLKAIIPLFQHEVPIKTSDEVDPEFGTGLMMVCTWGDQGDVKKWLTDGLDSRIVLGRNGKLNELAGVYQNLRVEKARPLIIKDLDRKGFLRKQEELTHTVNVHERCNTPIEFVNSKQWFIKIVDNKNIWLEFGSKIDWHPKSRFNDYRVWVDSLKWDWCISRQRYYGVPFPIWYCNDCDEPHFVPEEQLPHNPATDNCLFEKCRKCGSSKFIPEVDVVETWATSSCTPFLIKELVKNQEIKEKVFPNSLRPNAFEIIRTWDFYSIVKSYYHFNTIPFKDLMISGHGLDEEGRKISKRLGNYIPSAELLEMYGADGIRYWATGAELGSNLRFSKDEIEKGKRLATKLWNAARLICSHVDEFKEINLADLNLESVDIWIVQQLNKTISKVTKGFEEYTYSISRNDLEEFFWRIFADYYVEFIKYRLYGSDIKSKETATATAYVVFLAILKMYAPILPFVTEEIYSRISFGSEESIHLSNWPEPINLKKSVNDFDQVIQAVDEIRKHKTSQGVSLGEWIESYKFDTNVDLKKYKEFLQNVGRVKVLE
ncbi:valine--tRNA ligase [Patescibacteria group bacterium]|nr:valine--tRNA ligase [Patescibacteria group bacterium]MBU1868041.1 valine--tRNA ligase [Patescibacteria group bacterium]